MSRRRRLRLIADLDDDDDLDFGHDRLCKRRSRGSLQNDQPGQLWIDRYRPRRSSDVCVSNKKMNELRAWLNEGNGVLVCIGPPGAGKSTALEVMAAELDYHVIQWSEPITLSSYSSTHNHTTQWTGADGGHARMKSFLDFLLRSQRYRSLAAESRRQLIVIEELPYLGRPDELNLFRISCLKACRLSRSPIVFILSSTHENNHDAEKIFGKSFFCENSVRLLNFRAVTEAAMRKALRRVVDGECLSYGDDVIDAVITNANGDIRTAIHQLQYQNSNDSSVLEAVAFRDEAVSVFHALGRILHAKLTMNEPEKIITSSTLNDAAFVQYLHENYLDFITESVEIQRDVISSLSIAEVLSQEMPWQDERALPPYASSTASRSYIIAKRNSQSTRSQFKPVRAPYGRFVVSQANTTKALASRSTLLSVRTIDAFCWTLPYLALMQNQKRFNAPDELLQRIRTYSAGGQLRSESVSIMHDWDPIAQSNHDLTEST